jgi:hypothetical protein
MLVSYLYHGNCMSIHWQTQVLKSHFYEGWLMVVSGEEKRSFVRGTEGQTLFACFF